jgi:hypothetical protein
LEKKLQHVKQTLIHMKKNNPKRKIQKGHKTAIDIKRTMGAGDVAQVAALQAQSPGFKPQTHQKKKL